MAGAILVYAAIKDVNPKDVAMVALGGDVPTPGSGNPKLQKWDGDPDTLPPGFKYNGPGKKPSIDKDDLQFNPHGDIA